MNCKIEFYNMSGTVRVAITVPGAVTQHMDLKRFSAEYEEEKLLIFGKIRSCYPEVTARFSHLTSLSQMVKEVLQYFISKYFGEADNVPDVEISGTNVKFVLERTYIRSRP